jgi:hypothetical protein
VLGPPRTLIGSAYVTVTEMPVGVEAACARAITCSDVRNSPTLRLIDMEIPSKVLNQNLLIT